MIDMAERLQKFKDRGIAVGFIVLAETGLDKSIMDAHDNFRRFLSKHGIHDYKEQSSGADNKKILPTLLFSSTKVPETSTSLYRPETKSGDPRIWIYKLGGFANPGDLLAVAAAEQRLVAINCSQSDFTNLLTQTLFNT